MAAAGSAIVCDRLRLYGNSSLCDRLRSAICDPRSSAIIWKPALSSGNLIKQRQRRRQRERHLKIQLFRERLSKRSVRADLHGTIFVACDNDLRQAHDMIYDCCVSQKKYRSILKHVLKRCDNRKSCRRPVVSLLHATNYRTV